MLRDLVWAVVFFTTGVLLLSFAPIDTDPLWFLVAGWASLVLGAVLAARFAMDRMDNPLERPWVDPVERWGDAHARPGVPGWRAGSGRK